MKTEPYSMQLDKKLKARGTSRIWLWRQMTDNGAAGSRTHFWRKVSEDTLSKEEKQKIKALLK